MIILIASLVQTLMKIVMLVSALSIRISHKLVVIFIFIAILSIIVAFISII